MPIDKQTQWLCDQVFQIFKKHNLSLNEIEYLLSGTGPAPNSEALNEASSDIANLFLKENVSIIQASTVFKECCRLFK